MDEKADTTKTTFRLEIELGNDTMQNGHDIAGALQRAAGYVQRECELGVPAAEIAGNVRDLNGNLVGAFRTEAAA